MAGQTVFLVHLRLFFCVVTNICCRFWVLLVVEVLFVLSCCCCCCCCCCCAYPNFVWKCVCVVHGCVCLLTLRLASLSHFSYLQHSLFILGKVYTVLGVLKCHLSCLFFKLFFMVSFFCLASLCRLKPSQAMATFVSIKTFSGYCSIFQLQ